ncbi:MAG: aspartate kinase, partial [Myxococcota bacterium]
DTDPGASVDWERSAAQVRAALPPDFGGTAVVTGYIASNAEGHPTTLGRNGSDFSASIMACLLNASQVHIWTDVDGVMTADPSLVSGAKSIATMRFDEAAELAYFGSRVLHPATLLPAMESNIPVRVLNTNRPDHPGTVISAQPPPKPEPVTSIAYKEDQTVLTIRDARMFEQVGFLARAFNVLSQHEVVIDMVATSEVSVSVTSHDRAGLLRAVDDLSALGEVELSSDKTILAVVGRNIHGAKGIGARVMQAIAAADVNVQMHSFGMSSNNMSLVVDDADIGRAVTSLHRELFESA